VASGDLLPGLFALRGGMLSGAIPPELLRGALSGLIIGREVVDGLARTSPGTRVLLVAPDQLGDLYESALAAHGVRAERRVVDHGRAFARLALRNPRQRLVTTE
jgi:2-keto-3-deoxy-galactonokinase